MGDIFTNLKRTFNSGNILAKLIYINVGLFVIIRLASVILMLFNLGGFACGVGEWRAEKGGSFGMFHVE